LVGDGGASEDVSFDDFGLGCFGNIVNTGWEDGIAIVGSAVLCEESDKTLEQLVSRSPREVFLLRLTRTVNAAIAKEAN
jgi:hypothetical protein